MPGRGRGLALRRAVKAAGGDAEPFEAYAAFALVDLVAGSSAGDDARGCPNVELVLGCDLYAWRCGHTHPGEVCHIIGGGPDTGRCSEGVDKTT